MSQGYKIVLDNSNEQTVSNTRGLPTLDIFDQHILNGTAWEAAAISSCTSGALTYYHIRTPNTTTLHNLLLDFSIEHPTTGGAVVSLYKSPATHTITGGATGTVVAPVNRYLGNTANTTTVQIFKGTTYESSLTAGNLIESYTTNVSSPNVSIGRYLLASNENYTIKYQSVASNTTLHLNANWYPVNL